MASSCPKLKIYELKTHRGVTAMAMNNDVNIEEKLTCRFKTDMMNLTNSDPSTQKLKNFQFK